MTLDPWGPLTVTLYCEHQLPDCTESCRNIGHAAERHRVTLARKAGTASYDGGTVFEW